MKKIGFIFLITLTFSGLYYVWFVHFNYRFEAITEGKVYSSAKIPPEKIAGYLLKYKIKTVIDLRHPGIQDALNPERQEGIDLERAAVEKFPGIRYVNIQSAQVPSKDNLANFFEVMDDRESYPVLIHCYHGTGRAMIYSAIYRIEYERMLNEDARGETRFKLSGSSFDEGRPKGDFLITYKARKEGNNSTLNIL